MRTLFICLNRIQIRSIGVYYQSVNKNAVHLLEENLDKIDWCLLSFNQNAIHILRDNLEKIDWMCFSTNPSIFEIDYESIQKRMDIIREELMIKTWRPDRIERMKNMYMQTMSEEEAYSCAIEQFLL